MALELGSIVLIHIVTLFFISAAAKLVSFQAFIDFTIDFRILPERLSKAAAVSIPFLELLGAGLLLVGPARIYGTVILVSLLLLFGYAVTRVLKTNRQVSCGCYGKLIDAKADSFTIGKIVYFLGLILFFTAINPPYTAALSAPAVITGTALTLLFLLTQLIWETHSAALERLRRIK
ncbi:hypothetical protein K8O68_03885 [Salipaludibacillus sp. CUR1]|uniref:MauE/DoxX family redox-associated membrane protein n=1 Tax=Salipaludibacillus sp. CUR1 TaxID=2820003 RepID=UPI001E2C2D9E|nr:MauE/DoxX family redox-associated membrane protein [Salipaludibacillus sp. CUR1]MCE7791566.1 hypothetical protein [Salipaludibacillus sp. CUR1]